MELEPPEDRATQNVRHTMFAVAVGMYLLSFTAAITGNGSEAIAFAMLCGIAIYIACN